LDFRYGPWRYYKGVGDIHMNRGRVGEERGGKETDRCPLTIFVDLYYIFYLQYHGYFLFSTSLSEDNTKWEWVVMVIRGKGAKG
jgi:hypothetical protein